MDIQYEKLPPDELVKHCRLVVMNLSELKAENKRLREILGAAEKVVEAAREVAATEVVRDHCVWEWELSEALEEFDKLKEEVRDES